MAEVWYFKCRSNENAPAMPIHSLWEAREMRTHPDYYEVDETGLPVAELEPQSDNRIVVRVPKRR